MFDDSPLSDDIRDWPDDPRELLGVSADADEPTLRRAYNCLVRRFNPERFPEQFMRIRSAYEWLQRIASFHGRVIEWTPPTGEKETAFAVVEPESKAETRSPAPAAAAHAAWQRAIDGDLPEAFRALKSLHERHPHEEVVNLQLYWLQRIALSLFNAKVETDAFPDEWLIRGIEQHGPHSRSWWQYLQLLELSPAFSLLEGCTRLLSMPELRAYVRPLLQIRWFGIAAAEDWQRIRDDLERLRAIGSVEDSTWMHTLFLAADFVAWSYHPEACRLFDECSRELERFTQFELDATAAFDRFYHLCDLTAWYRTMPEPWLIYSHLRDLLDLVRESWNRPAIKLRDRALDVVQPWVEAPLVGLRKLDQLGGSFPHGLGVLHDLWQQLSTREPWISDEDRSRRDDPVIGPMLLCASTGYYEGFRQNMLSLIVQESVTIDQIIEIGLRTAPEAPWANWCQQLHDDLPLRTLAAALRAFWS